MTLQKTTIQIYQKDLEWWTRSRKQKAMTSCDLFSGIRESCKTVKQRDRYYADMSMPSDYVKLLAWKKIRKNYNK